VRLEVDRFVALVGHMISVMSAYGDASEVVRRTQPMSTAAELVLQMLPPLTYGADNLVISAIVQPVYTVGGDAFDYAVLDSTLHLGVFDSTGHHLRAGLTTAVTLSATRAARRAGVDIVAQAAAADEALAGEFGDSRFTTAMLSSIDLTTGDLRYVNAGHPPPLVLRGDRVVATLRRMNHDVLSRYVGPPADDATLLLVEWSGEAVRRLAP
jgi:serine phosphatase RsbU (regulator of sigma subunit)